MPRRAALTENGTGREPHPEGERHRAGLPPLRESHWLPNWLPKLRCGGHDRFRLVVKLRCA